VSSSLEVARNNASSYANPTLKKIELCNHQARALATINDKLYVVAREGGLYIFDIKGANGDMELLGHYQPEGKDFIDVAVTDKRIYLAAIDSVEVFDITNSDSITPVGTFMIETESLGYVESVSVNDGESAITLSNNAVLLHSVSAPVNSVADAELLPLEKKPNHAIYQANSVYVTVSDEILKLAR